jgi:hypothetical protein
MVYAQGSNGLGKLDVSSLQVSSILKVRYCQIHEAMSNSHRANSDPMYSSSSPWGYPSFLLQQQLGLCHLYLIRRFFWSRYLLVVGLYLQSWYEALPALCLILGITSTDDVLIWYAFNNFTDHF